MSILGLLANDPAIVPMRCHEHHAIICSPNRYMFRDNMNFWYLVVPMNNFTSMSNCPRVQGKFIKPPPLPRCVWGG